MKRFSLIIVSVLYASCSGVMSHDAPVGQPALANLDVASFKQQFNAAPGARMVILLSPT